MRRAKHIEMKRNSRVNAQIKKEEAAYYAKQIGKIKLDAKIKAQNETKNVHIFKTTMHRLDELEAELEKVRCVSKC